MARNPSAHEHRVPRHVRRWAREIALAVLLTLAAATFITVALMRGTPSVTPQFETARKAPTN
jgi:hypothetical protein